MLVQYSILGILQYLSWIFVKHLSLMPRDKYLYNIQGGFCVTSSFGHSCNTQDGYLCNIWVKYLCNMQHPNLDICIMSGGKYLCNIWFGYLCNIQVWTFVQFSEVDILSGVNLVTMLILLFIGGSCPHSFTYEELIYAYID